jgi:hypothetical protein
MAHDIVGLDVKINYDTYSLIRPDGTHHKFGMNKLRTLIDACHVEVEQITTPLLNQILKGKQFKANIVVNDKKYPQINYADIYPLEYDKPALNDHIVDAPKTVATTEKKVLDEDKAKELIKKMDIL